MNISHLDLFVPMVIPSPETQSNFNNSIKNNFNLSSESWTTHRRVIDTQLECQLDIGSVHKINSPRFLVAAHQTSERSAALNKANNAAIFDNLNVRKDFEEIEGFRYPRDLVNVDYNTNNYLDQKRDRKIFYREYTGEPFLGLFVICPDIEKFYPIHVSDLRYHVNHKPPKNWTIWRM